MKTVSLLILGLVAVASASPMMEDNKLATTSLKDKQIMIMKLLNNVMQPLMYKELVDLGKDFKIEECTECYTKTEVHKKFVNTWKVGTLPRGEIFTLHIERQMKEVITAFHLLYYAKDFTTFMKTACWMRLNMNEGMFVYALTVACRHREDCKNIVLPAPYEIYPYFFVRGDVIQKAYMLKMKKGMLPNYLCDFYGIKKTDKDVYVIDENVYDKRVYLSDEDKLRYFTEDIDLNTYYYYFHVDYPFWMKDNTMNKLNIRRFEMTTYMYQQILARYYLERLSNGLGDIPTLSWYKPVKAGVWPWLNYHNGVQMPIRWNHQTVVRDDNVNVMRLVEDYETIIREAILKGHCEINGMRFELNKPEDIETLGKLIYGKIDKNENDHNRVEAYRYLLIICKSVLGLNTIQSNNYFVAPTLLDNYQTALRDPVFYQLQKRLIDFVLLFKKRMPCYTHEDLYFPGVKIDNIVIDKLVTYFDYYFMDMTNAITYTDEELKKTHSDMTFLVRKRRLNHEPFKVTLDIASDKTVDCVIRIFMGPKKDHLGRLIDINRNRINFVELDSFMYKLNSGKNTIVRNSMDMHNLIRDRFMTNDLWKKFDNVNEMKDIFVKDLNNYNTGYPTRLLLPKGRVGGMEMMFYVIVTPLKMVDNVDFNILNENNIIHNNNNNNDDKQIMMRNFRSTVLLDKMPLGFPFDREIDTTKFYTPNMKFFDVMIFHKKQVCDMKTRWEKYVLKNYNMWDKTGHNFEAGTYFEDIQIDTDAERFNTNNGRVIDM